MSVIRRWGQSPLLFCLIALALPSGAARTAPESPPAPDAKVTDALIRDALKNVINEGANMYNGEGVYTQHDYLGCHHLYEGALIAIRPLLSNHPDLQKAIDDGLENARNTPRPEMRAFVLRDVIDQIRDSLKPGGPTVTPLPTEKTTQGKMVRARNGQITLKVDGKEIAFAIPDSTTIVIDGKPGKLPDVKDDSTVTVTSKDEVVTKVDAKSPATAPPPPKVVLIEGKVVGVDKDKLTVSVDDKPKVFTVPADATVTIDGEAGKLADLKKDSTARVKTQNDVVVAIDAKNAPPPPPPVETKTSGKVIKVVGDKITVLPAIGEAKDFTIPDDAKITLDGKDAKADAIKTDSTVTVTTKGDAVTKVEAKAAVPPPQEKTTHGFVTKADGNKIAVKPAAGDAKDFTIPDDAKVTIDGKDGKAGDIKVDSAITITETDGKITRVETKAPGAPLPQTLWERLGGETGVAKVVDDFVNTAGKDPKVNFYRDSMHVPSKEEEAALKTHLVAFVSSATGGPLKYKGKDMKEVHAGMKIKDSEFDACAADLKTALEKNGVKAEDVKAVMDVVEGTRKDIVEIKGDDKPKPPEDKLKN